MKNIIVAGSLTFLIVSVISCSKNGVQPRPLAAKWNIINDSLSIVSLNGTNYIGTSADYYNFTADGTLYIKEDALPDTTTYSMVDNNQVEKKAISEFIKADKEKPAKQKARSTKVTSRTKRAIV